MRRTHFARVLLCEITKHSQHVFDIDGAPGSFFGTLTGACAAGDCIGNRDIEHLNAKRPGLSRVQDVSLNSPPPSTVHLIS